MKNKHVFIGGFASNHRQVEIVADELSQFFDDEVEGLSLREAISEPVRVDAMVRGSCVVTHSAGIIALHHTSPREIVAVAPPIPVSVPRLVGRAAVKTSKLTIGSLRSMDRFRRVNGYNIQSSAELIAHPISNFRLLGGISQVDSLELAAAAYQNDIDVTIGFMSEDVFFRPTDTQLEHARKIGLHIVSGVKGEHDEVLLYPNRVVNDILIARDVN